MQNGTPNLGPHNWSPNLGPQVGGPIWGSILGPKCGPQSWAPDLGPKFGGPKLGAHIWGPNLGPKFGAQIWVQIWAPKYFPVTILSSAQIHHRKRTKTAHPCTFKASKRPGADFGPEIIPRDPFAQCAKPPRKTIPRRTSVRTLCLREHRGAF